MTPGDMIDALLECPYVAGSGAMSGADCWGIVELWYLHVLEITLDDRAGHPAGHDGLQAGFDDATRWEAIDGPVDHCLVVMRAGFLDAGHIGVFYDGRVLHSDETHGCVYQPISDRFIRSKITGYLKYK